MAAPFEGRILTNSKTPLWLQPRLTGILGEARALFSRDERSCIVGKGKGNLWKSTPTLL